MSRSSRPSTADELVEEGYRHVNDCITRMFTRALERNPGADLGDVLQMALRKYPSLRRRVEERPRKRQRKGMYLLVANPTDADARRVQLFSTKCLRTTKQLQRENVKPFTCPPSLAPFHAISSNPSPWRCTPCLGSLPVPTHQTSPSSYSSELLPGRRSGGSQGGLSSISVKGSS